MIDGSNTFSIAVAGSASDAGVYGFITRTDGDMNTSGVFGLGHIDLFGLTTTANSGSAGVVAVGDFSHVARLGTPDYAGDFHGDVIVRGNLSKSGGSFKIDHPLDPANKYLSHSFVESPDMKNIYDGVATLNASGEAVVELPEGFEALNKDFRYQLPAVGAPGPNLHIAKKISGNRFTIAGGASGMEVSWQVTGTRQDAWANAHRIVVEETKPTSERGTYLAPEVLGKPREQGVNWAERSKLTESLKKKSAPAAEKQAEVVR